LNSYSLISPLLIQPHFSVFLILLLYFPFSFPRLLRNLLHIFLLSLSRPLISLYFLHFLLLFSICLLFFFFLIFSTHFFSYSPSLSSHPPFLVFFFPSFILTTFSLSITLLSTIDTFQSCLWFMSQQRAFIAHCRQCLCVCLILYTIWNDIIYIIIVYTAQ